MDKTGVTVAIPNSTVERYRAWCLVPVRRDQSSEEIRKSIERIFTMGYGTRTQFSLKFGRSGFGIKFVVTLPEGNETFWLICNEDMKTTYDFVAVTIYNDDMFNKRQQGLSFTATAPVPIPVADRRDEVSLDDDSEEVCYLVTWGEKRDQSKVVTTKEECIELLTKLYYDENMDPEDWTVWRQVKSDIKFDVG